jgi:hypothetical protein
MLVGASRPQEGTLATAFGLGMLAFAAMGWSSTQRCAEHGLGCRSRERKRALGIHSELSNFVGSRSFSEISPFGVLDLYNGLAIAGIPRAIFA